MSETFDPGEHTVAEVEEYVAENPDEREAMLKAEQAGKNRVTLVSSLSDEPEVGLTVTTTKTKDFLARGLINATPGTSQATDFLGRSVVTGDKDFLGRALLT